MLVIDFVVTDDNSANERNKALEWSFYGLIRGASQVNHERGRYNINNAELSELNGQY